MKFAVSRTSVWGDEEPPCEGAFRGLYTKLDVRSVSDPSMVPAHFGQTEWWFKEGENHRVENGYITREFDGEDWFIEIETLDDLLAFCQQYGRVVVSPFLFNNNMWSIEIYDDYRE